MSSTQTIGPDTDVTALVGQTFVTRWGLTEIMSAEHFTLDDKGGVMFAGAMARHGESSHLGVAALPYGDVIRPV